MHVSWGSARKQGAVQGDLFSEEMSKMVWKNYENEKNNWKQGNLIE